MKKIIWLICIIFAFAVGFLLTYDKKESGIAPREIRLVGDEWDVEVAGETITWTLPTGEFVENWNWQARDCNELIRVIDANGLHLIKPKQL